MLAMKNTLPIGSNCKTVSIHPSDFTPSAGGDFRNSIMNTIATAPMGRLTRESVSDSHNGTKLSTYCRNTIATTHDLLSLVSYCIPGEAHILVNAPPNNGPTTLAIPQTAPIMPVKAGRLANGIDLPTMIRAPEKMPAPPIPAIARPTIRTTELGLAPQIADPISKISTAPEKVHLIERRV